MIGATAGESLPFLATMGSSTRLSSAASLRSRRIPRGLSEPRSTFCLNQMPYRSGGLGSALPAIAKQNSQRRPRCVTQTDEVTDCNR